jgi:xylulose-5-phosphate/fructose-6-phosphate phosphoketolase
MGANPHANGGALLRDLRMPDFREYAIDVPMPGNSMNEDARTLGKFLRDVIRRNDRSRNFRIFGPDETASNRLAEVYGMTDKQWVGEVVPTDDHLARDGRVVEMLSEHQCEGWLEGYLLTGRHGLFNCYEAFIHIIDSMFNQHAKWLKVTRHIPWRRPIASLNILLASHVWRQDHNGFTHQDPGFIDHVCNKKAEVVRVYLPPDTNTLLSVDGPLPAEPPLRQRGGRQQAPVAAVARDGPGDQALHGRDRDLGVGQQRQGGRPRRGHGLRRGRADAGDGRRGPDPPRADPGLKIRVVNVVDLMRLQPEPSTRTGCPTGTSTPCSPRTSRSSSPTTATRG